MLHEGHLPGKDVHHLCRRANNILWRWERAHLADLVRTMHWMRLSADYRDWTDTAGLGWYSESLVYIHGRSAARYGPQATARFVYGAFDSIAARGLHWDT